MGRASDPPPVPLDVGLRLLSEGRWEDARAAFDLELSARESAEALEGLSWAAWWLDDAPAVFDARERAYRLYRRRGDRAGAARMAIWLAIDQLDFNGTLAVAKGWLSRAARLLESLGPGPEHGWLAFQQGYLAHLAGDSSTASALGRTAADVGRRDGIADLEILGLALEGGALVAGEQVTEGMRCLDEAAAAALEREARIPISSAWAFCFLVSACLDVRDYRRAFEWSDRIAEFARRYRSRYMLGFCRSHYGAVHLSRGRWADAETELLAAADAYTRSRPAMAREPLVWLAELRRRQGRLDDAEELARRTGDGAAARLCLGRVALDRGDPQRAADIAERCLRQTPKDRGPDRVAALELRIQALAAADRAPLAAAALVELRRLERRIATPPLQASLRFAEGTLAAGARDWVTARACFEDAGDAYERVGAVYEALVSRTELARCLLKLGRTADALEEAGRARHALAALGAEREAARAQAFVEQCESERSPDAPPGILTPREHDVLRLVATGMTNRQIAKTLVLSDHTIHRHVTNILRKLDLPSRAAAAAYAVRLGL